MARERNLPDVKSYANQSKSKTNFNKPPAEKKKKATPPKPRAKPARKKPAEVTVTRKDAKGKSAPKTPARKPNDSRSRAQTKSGASRSVKAKVSNSVGSRLVRGAKRIFGTEKVRKTTGNKNFKANRPR